MSVKREAPSRKGTSEVPGHLDESWTEWDGRMTLRLEGEGSDPPITILAGTLDQAVLHGLLRRLYARSLPLTPRFVLRTARGNEPPSHPMRKKYDNPHNDQPP